MAWRNDQVSEKETEKILEIVRSCLKIPGDFVEMGCYKGDTSLLLAEEMRNYSRHEARSGPLGPSLHVPQNTSRVVSHLYLYDSFEGLPEKRVEDESALGENFRGGELYVTKREVKERFLRAGLKVPVIKKAWFSDLSEEDLPPRISFAFLDGDFYESIRDSLSLVAPKMVNGGVIIVHDYSNPELPGVAKAVDEWKKNYVNLRVDLYQSMIIMYCE